MRYSYERLRDARERCGLTRSQAARTVGCAEASIVSWELGRTSPRASRLGELADRYRCRVEDFFEVAG